MSVLLRESIFIAGTHTPVGSTVELGPALEADLVHQGKATWVDRPLAPGEALSAIRVERDAAGEITALVDDAGTDISVLLAE